MQEDKDNSISRRGFLAAGVVSACMLGLGGYGAFTQEAAACYVRPPGTESDADLVARCDRCQRCVQVCPYNIITPLPLSKNLMANGTPLVDFSQGYCDYCMLCLEVCPTGALRGGTPTENNIGVAVVLSDACVAWNWVGCTVCIEECPVEGALVLDELDRPVVDSTLCDGCGRCEQVCPASSLRAYDDSLEEKGIIVVSRLSEAAIHEGAIPGQLLREQEHKREGGTHG